SSFLCLEVSMDMNLSARCALVLFLLAFVDLKIVSAAETEGTSTAKPGVCPVRRWGMGICAELCSNDSDCPNDEKCCHNGCGHNCIAPYTAKPGVCPRRPWGVGTCAEFCSNDSDCPNDEKCCYNGCGHNCISFCNTHDFHCSSCDIQGVG
uniref:WAP domain-containing protein n=1 Tax=Oncorhynchus kisutch TaxID=8019 RepID=A0A8C7HKR0_ONCKI